MRSEGGGFAASIYEAMPERGFLVTSHSYDTSRPLETEVPQRDSEFGLIQRGA